MSGKPECGGCRPEVRDMDWAWAACVFPNIRAAARAMGVSRETARKYMLRNGFVPVRGRPRKTSR